MTFLALIPLFAHATDITLPVVGHVTDPAGQPIQGTHAVTVALWADEAASISLHTEAPVVGFADGTFAVVLGQTGDLTVDDLASAPEVWLTIQLDDGARSTPARLGYAPFAAIAARAASLGDLAPEDVAVVPAAGPCGRVPRARVR